jgi:hypothetical protein
MSCKTNSMALKECEGLEACQGCHYNQVACHLQFLTAFGIKGKVILGWGEWNSFTSGSLSSLASAL